MSNLANQIFQDQLIDQALEFTTTELATQLKLPIDALGMKAFGDTPTPEKDKEILFTGMDIITYDELVDRWVQDQWENTAGPHG
jgi:hypothetical protein